MSAAVRRALLRLRACFRRGHTTYFVFAISLANFVAIQYQLVVAQLPGLRELFPDIATFALAFALAYVPAATLVGWLDFRRLAVPVDQELLARSNPWVRDLMLALALIAEGRAREAVPLLRRWAGEGEARGRGCAGDSATAQRT